MPTSKWRLVPALVLTLFCEAVLSEAAAEYPVFGDSLVRDHQVQDVLEHEPVQTARCQHIPTGPIEATSCDYETIESVTETLYDHLHELVETPFFRYYRVDLYRDCPFWSENGFCMNRECGISTVDESEIPEKWRAASLSKIEMPPDEVRNMLPGCYYRDSDFCFLDDPAEGDYVDLIANPEAFTGYEGLSANRVWSSIYNENCFGLSELNLLKSPAPALVSLPDSLTDTFREDESESYEQCLEKRVYYKLISGLHASISTHLCHESLNQTTGEWSPNIHCFVSRVASHPERLQYIYFDTVLLLRAVARLGPYLSAYDYCSSGTHEEDAYTLRKLGAVIGIAKAVGQFDESVLFRGENANILKEEFKQHFRNVTRIMDCVGCDKCRLWGKVQTSGLGTALKVLFEMDEKSLDPTANQNLLSRSEVVALINTLHRLVESLHFVGNFRQMWIDAPEDESNELIREAESAVGGHPRQSESVSDADADSTPYPVSQTKAYEFAVVDFIKKALSIFRRRDKTGIPHSDL